MKKYIINILLIFSTFLYAENGAVDKNTVLDFEGITNGSVVEIGDFYKEQYGITFGRGSLVIVDSDDGGTGNFANEPKPGHTVAFFLDTSELIMNVEKGFTNGFSFYYSSNQNGGSVVVYDGLNGSGKPIKTIELSALGSTDGGGDPNGTFNRWETIGVEFDGTAKSVSFAGVANQIGFDKITFNGTPPQEIFDINFALYNKGGMDAILHPTTDPYSNTFKTIFKVDSSTEDISEICNNYTFKVEDVSGNGARQTKCTYTPIANDTSALIEVDFIINKSDNGYYFEDANLSLCKKDDSSNCNKIDAVKNFTIYGTGFSITRDAFKFANGKWNDATGDIEDFDTKLDFVKPKNDIAYATHTVSNYITDYKSRENLWESVGYELDIENNILWDKEHTSMGLCHGMAFSAISNFNYRLEDSAWGVDGDIETKWKTQIDDHWDSAQNEAKASYKSLSNNTYSYSTNNIEALKKIIYYFVTQGFYSDSPDNNWNGDYPFDYDMAILSKRNQLKNILKNGSPWGMRFSLANNKGGHAVVSTQFISYNNIDKWYIYDNNKPEKYLYYKVKDNSNYSILVNNKIFFNTSSVYKIVNLGARIGDDTSAIYGDLLPSTTSSTKQKAASKAAQTQEDSYEYLLPSHIKVYMVGGAFKTIIDTSTNKEVKTIPYMGELLADGAYQQNSNIFSNSVYLPIEKIYKVTVQKEKDFPLFKIFSKIPDKDGMIEVVHYDNIESDANDSTIVTFYVGTNNTNKILKRDNASNMGPTNDDSFTLKITSVTNSSAVVLQDKVKLSWENPQNPNLEQIIIVRKENEKPSSITDGTVFYPGTDEAFSDDTGSNNAQYFYAIYAKAKNGNYSEAVYQFVDTYKYSIYGTIKDTNGNRIKDISVELKTANMLKTINVTNTDKNGFFALSNLTNGNYNLSFMHATYTFTDPEINVTVQDKSIEVTTSGTAQPALIIGVNDIIQAGDSEKISWNGTHINKNATVNIKLFRDGKWETIASNVPYNQHSYKWNVTAPQAEAKLRVELDDTTFVEEDIVIFGDMNTDAPSSGAPSSGDSSSGGGALDYLLPLLILGLLLFRRKD